MQAHLERVQLGDEGLLDLGRLWPPQHRPHLLDHPPKAVAQALQLGQAFFEGGGKLQQAEGVAGGGGVKHDAAVIHALHLYVDW